MKHYNGSLNTGVEPVAVTHISLQQRMRDWTMGVEGVIRGRQRRQLLLGVLYDADSCTHAVSARNIDCSPPTSLIQPTFFPESIRNSISVRNKSYLPDLYVQPGCLSSCSMRGGIVFFTPHCTPGSVTCIGTSFVVQPEMEFLIEWDVRLRRPAPNKLK